MRHRDEPPGGEREATDYFEHWSPELFEENLWYQRTYGTLTRGLVRGDVLDLGCGSRVYYDVENAERWVGLDPSAKLLAELSFSGGRQPARVEKLNRGCWDLPFPERSFDTVCAFFLFHHLARSSRRLSRERVLRVMRDVRRVLRDDGVFLIAENAARAIQGPYKLLYPPLYGLSRKLLSVELPYFWSVREWLQLVEEAGFSEPVVCHLPIRERIINPMWGFALPPFLVEIVQRMTLLVIRP